MFLFYFLFSSRVRRAAGLPSSTNGLELLLSTAHDVIHAAHWPQCGSGQVYEDLAKVYEDLDKSRSIGSRVCVKGMECRVEGFFRLSRSFDLDTDEYI